MRLWTDRRGAAAKGDRRAGFTLVEMLVVLVIIGLIMGLVGPRVLGYLSDAKEKTARIQIENFKSALDLYYLDTGRYPSTTDGLGALVRRPGATDGWNGPYLRDGAVPPDPWGNPYVYRSPGEAAPYEVSSLGAKGKGKSGSGNGAAIR
jgi:general secretion pathway protein G